MTVSRRLRRLNRTMLYAYARTRTCEENVAGKAYVDYVAAPRSRLVSSEDRVTSEKSRGSFPSESSDRFREGPDQDCELPVLSLVTSRQSLS